MISTNFNPASLGQTLDEFMTPIDDILLSASLTGSKLACDIRVKGDQPAFPDTSCVFLIKTSSAAITDVAEIDVFHKHGTAIPIEELFFRR